MTANLHHVLTGRLNESTGGKAVARIHIRQGRIPEASRAIGIVGGGARIVQHMMNSLEMIEESVVDGIDLPKVVHGNGLTHVGDTAPLIAGTAAKIMMTPLPIAADADGLLLPTIDGALEEDGGGIVVGEVTHPGPHDRLQLLMMSLHELV